MKKIFIALVGMAIAIPPVFADTWYVSALNGNDGNSGATWALAKKTIQAGVDLTIEGDTVWVTNGTYTLTNQVTITNVITVRSVNGVNVTIVNGGYPATTNRCFYLTVNAMLDGFTITNGHGGGGGGVYGGSATNCTITGNSSLGQGGGIMCCTVNNCIISGNSASGAEGGGVYNGTALNCTITENSADTCGGGVGHSTIKNCIISGNSTLGNGGGVWECTVENCTIVENSAALNGGGVHGISTLQNSIIFFNTASLGNDNYYCCIPFTNCCTRPLPPGPNNIYLNPQFVNTATDFRLKLASPCINTGTNQTWMTNAVDLAGNPRIINDVVDMGAYESTNAYVPGLIPGPPTNVSASDGTFGDKIQVIWSEVSGADGYIVYRNTNNDCDFSSISFQGTHSPYNDTNALPGSYYYYWVVTTTTNGESELSNSDRGYRRELDIDLSNVGAVFIDEHYHLYKVLNNDEVTNLCSTNFPATNILRSPQGYLFIGFNSPVRLNNDEYYMLAKVNQTNNAVTGIDTSLQSMAWGTLSPSLQLDQQENIYYFANQTGGKLVLKRWANATDIVSMINDNISISQWLVAPDGTVLMGGSTVSTGTKWFRALTSDLNLYNLETAINVYWLFLFPDARAYSGLSGGSYSGVYRLPRNLTSLQGANRYTTLGPEIACYKKTSDGRVFAMSGSQGNYNIIQYYPSPRTVQLSLVDRVSLIETCGSELLVAGVHDNANRLIAYNPASKAERVIMNENIEIYHLAARSDQNVWFDGLKFSGNQYVIGKINISNPTIAISKSYSEMTVLSGKLINIIKIEADASNSSLVPPDISTGVCADYDGDGKADPAIYDGATGIWRIRLSGSGYYLLVTTLNGLGGQGYASVSADYDGDGKADPAVYQESTGKWIILPSSLGYTTQFVLPQTLGGIGYSGIPEDYDGDGKADPGVYQREQGDWKVLLSSADYYEIESLALLGGTEYRAVAADYDGDGKADPAVYNESTGYWIFKLSSIGYLEIALTQTLGGTGYIPVPADYDGDAKADPAVKSETGNEWIVMFSSGGYTPVPLTILFE